MQEGDKKPMTIDDLAVMVANGFSDVKEEIKDVKDGLKEVKHEMSAMKSNLNYYLELSEKRYSELKWLKLVADKSGVAIDVSQLEKI